MPSEPRIGVVGATGAVGTITVELLRERGYRNVRLFASARSAGTELGGTTVEEATPEALAAGDLDLCLFSVGTSASRELVPHAVRGGALCVDKSAAFRLEPGIPLVVPEVNGARAAEHDGIVANPNCCAIPLTIALKPLLDAAGLRRVRVSTYQSVSGAGAQAMERLRGESPEEHDLRMDWSFDGVEFEEEQKLRDETRKILELPDLPISATCVRVPVLVGPCRGRLGRDGGAALRRGRDRAPRSRGGRPARAVPDPGRRGRRRRRPRRPHPARSDERERARALRRRRQPPQGRRAERDPDRRAPAGRAARRGLILAATVFSALSLLAPPPPTLIAAGDVASCRSSGDEATAALVRRLPGTVAVLGDIVYERGTAEEFRDCYSWAPFRGRTRAALGNHEYGTGTAAVAIDYFDLPARGYYSYSLGSWQVIVLNSNCEPAGGCGEGSPQQRWLARELARGGARCTLAYMHHPRFSSGLHGSDETIAPLWRTMSRGGVDVVLAGHDHHYERFAPVRRHPLVRRRHRRAQPLSGLPPPRAGRAASS